MGHTLRVASAGIAERKQLGGEIYFLIDVWGYQDYGTHRLGKLIFKTDSEEEESNGGEPFVLYFWFCTGGARIKIFEKIQTAEKSRG